MGLVLPGSPQWKRERDPRVRFRILEEAILEEGIKREPDLQRLEEWGVAKAAYNAVIVKTLPVVQSRSWDSIHNVHVTMDALGNAARYTQKAIQRMITAFIDERRHRAIWAIIWKYRQGGVSTKIAEEFYLGVTRGFGEKALVVAQADPEATVIFNEKYRFMYEHDPLAPTAARSNTEELDFPEIGGNISVRSAGGRKGVGRGGNRRYCHLSEIAWYQGNPYILVGGILQSITHAQAMVFMETTANGQAGIAYETALEALESEAAKREGRPPKVDTRWEYVFLPWFLDDEAKRGVAFASDEARFFFQKNMRDDEKLIQQEFGLTLEQMNWYRYIFDAKIKGESHDEKLMLIQQEYPSRPLDAFVAPGASAFNLPRIVNLTLKAKAPIFRGEITVHAATLEKQNLYDDKEGEWLRDTPAARPLPDEHGPLRIWKMPQLMHRYAMGVDLAASGEKKADFTEMYVIDRDTEEVVAHWMDKRDPTYSLAPCRLLSKFYNDAWICPEVNFEPSFTERLKKTDRRDFLFIREASPEAGMQDVAGMAYGWRTSPHGTTKAVLVSTLREALAFRPKMFVDKHVLDQMKNFKQIRTPSGEYRYPGALPGSGTHDDGVIALALAIICHDRMPLDGTGPRLGGDEDGEKEIQKPTVSERFKGHLEYEEQRRLEAGWEQ